MYIQQALSYIKMKILFHPITAFLKLPIYNTFSMVTGYY
ncbi:hypothetical protein BSGG_5213 [Bacteroides sp. D2]|nr:hypothetical protein BSGG_5213 [Bacteroides sp. D2]